MEHVLVYTLHGCYHPALNVVDVTKDSSNITNCKQSRNQKVGMWNAAKHYILRGIAIVACLFIFLKIHPVTLCNDDHNDHNDDHTQNPSLKTTTDKISLHDTEDDSNKAAYKVKSDKVKEKNQKNLRIHLRLVSKMVHPNTKQRLHQHSICSKGSCLLTKRQTQPAIMSRFLGMMTPSHSNSITVGMMIKVRDIDYVLKWIYSV